MEVCRSRTLRRASSSFLKGDEWSDSGRDVVIVVASVLIGGGVTSNDGAEVCDIVKGAITGRCDVMRIDPPKLTVFHEPSGLAVAMNFYHHCAQGLVQQVTHVLSDLVQSGLSCMGSGSDSS
ncbi:hypothetical protein Tco_0278474 [Tanacetum coccineum]